MLTWLKRIRAGAAQELPAESETPATEKVEKLLSRLNDHSKAAGSVVPAIPLDTLGPPPRHA